MQPGLEQTLRSLPVTTAKPNGDKVPSLHPPVMVALHGLTYLPTKMNRGEGEGEAAKAKFFPLCHA